MAKRAQKSPGGKATPTGARANNPAAAQAKPAAKPKRASRPKSTAKPASKSRSAPKAARSTQVEANAASGGGEESANLKSAPGRGQGRNQGRNQGGFPGGGMRMGDSENYLDFLARVFQDMSANQWDTQQFDNMTQGMSLVLGSGPAFAALESMMANTTAQSAVLMNAVQTQRQLDQVGLCCTSACVQQLLNMNNDRDAD